VTLAAVSVLTMGLIVWNRLPEPRVHHAPATPAVTADGRPRP
jgi:hypothetical protein